MRGIHRSPAQKPVTRSFDVFFDLYLNKRWVNTHGAGDLRRHCAHYDVTVMFCSQAIHCALVLNREMKSISLHVVITFLNSVDTIGPFY